MDIGFIGLGTMGSRVCENLVKGGNKVRVWNRSRGAVDALAHVGATPVSTAREAFSGDAVFSMLADDAAVRAVIDPLLDGAPKGLVHVNMATISVALARDLAVRHRARASSTWPLLSSVGPSWQRQGSSPLLWPVSRVPSRASNRSSQ